MKFFKILILSITYTTIAGVLDTQIKLASADVLKNRLYEKGYNDFVDKTGIADDFADKISPVNSIYSDLLSKIETYINDQSFLESIISPLNSVKMRKEIPEIVFKEWPHLLLACRHYTNHARVWGFDDDEDEFIASPAYLEALNYSFAMRANFTQEL